MTQTPDVLILDARPGGYAAAFLAAQLGQSVSLIREDKVGGTCLHRGCTKTASGHAAEVPDTGSHVPNAIVATMTRCLQCRQLSDDSAARS
jgi:dihydrolipoamide dehydrogenase